jgi:tellurite resistance protein TerC
VSTELAPWFLLFAIVGTLLAVDLLIVNRDARPVPFRRSVIWSVVWISLALGFGAYVAATRGSVAGGEYLAGYLIELSLSVDNVFVFALIFAAFAVPPAYQHRLLFWGILGAVVFRAAFITAGTAILAAAHWVIYLLGILLVVTGVRLARSRGHAVEPEKNPVLRVFRRIVPMTPDYRGASFFVREHGRRLATPLLAALVAVETTDIMFALDSIPAVFAVTTDPFIVFSSNLFAILGLRSLYFLLAGLLDRFVYLKLGLAALLVFAGAKILVGSVYKIPIAVSLGVIVAILATAIVASLVATHPGRATWRARATAGFRSWPAVRVATGLALGTLSTLLFVGLAVARDAGLTWLVVDVALVIVASLPVVFGLAMLRRMPAESGLVRGWLTVGAVTIAAIALLAAMD